MDARRQHERFKALMKPLVDMRLQWDPAFAKDDWVVQCYNSQRTLESYFPDRRAFEQILDGLTVRMRTIEERVATEMDRIRSQGLSYLDIEQLRYPPSGSDEQDSFEVGTS